MASFYSAERYYAVHWGRKDVYGLRLCWILHATIDCTARQNVSTGAIIRSSQRLSDGFEVCFPGGEFMSGTTNLVNNLQLERWYAVVLFW